MKISREEYKNIRYICKKFNISPDSVNLKKLAASLNKRLLRRRIVIGFGIKHHKNVHSIVFNVLRRIDLRHKYSKENVQKGKKNKISWRRAVRRSRCRDMKEAESELDGTEIDEVAVRDRLKEQLQLLQLGKKKAFRDDKSKYDQEEVLRTKSEVNCTSKKAMENDIHLESLDDTDEMDSLRVTPTLEISCNGFEKSITDSNEKSSQDEKIKSPECIQSTSNSIDKHSKVESAKKSIPSDCKDAKSQKVTPSKEGFLDSLLNKFKQKSAPNTPLKSRSLVAAPLVEPKSAPITRAKIKAGLQGSSGIQQGRMRRRKPVHEVKQDTTETVLELEKPMMGGDDTSSPTEFYGFDEAEIPGMLPTPRAKNTIVSAFIDSENISEVDVKLEKLVEEKLIEVKPQKVDKREHEGLVCAGSKPPILSKPMRLISIQKPRTVFQKRQLMQKKKGIKFLMMENESKIFNELSKINREDYDYQFNFPMLTALQKETVPYRRDAWRALSWLKTEKNRYFYKVIYVDGVKCNLLGSRGNFDGKKKFRTSSLPFPKFVEFKSRHQSLRPIKIPRYYKLNLAIPDDNESQSEPLIIKKLLDFDLTYANSKPGPLCAKVRLQRARYSADECLGPLEVYNMPTVSLELFPQLGRPIDQRIIPYLKYLLPYENITEEWAKYSVSLFSPDGKETKTDSPYSFEIPYENNQTKIMIRRKKEIDRMGKDALQLVDNLEKPLEFLKSIEPHDEIGMEVGQILKEMTNSVAIGLAENFFIQDDPDLDYTKTDTNLEKISPTKPVKDQSVSRKIVRELKKLNATFIQANNQLGKMFNLKKFLV